MKISYNWLKELLPFNLSAQETGVYLTNCGLEVEGMETFETVRGGLKGLVIGEVLTCEAHPNSDHLHVTTVNVGGEEPLHIVCGAPNVAAGQKVVVATIGTTLYSGDESFTIKKSKLRGEPSEGMICAEDEIGLGSSHDGIMVLDPEAVPGTPASEYFHVESDTIFEIGLTPNRCDAISHVGVARDLYAALNQNGVSCSPLILPTASELKPIANPKMRVSVTVENRQACPRYTGLLLDNVKVADSPEWLQTKLRSVGIRPINNVVDVTQYIMLEVGQPMHAFDADQIKGNHVIVKNLPEGTPFVTLDGNEVKLSAEDLMICNEEEGMCIAGVYGGLKSGVTQYTTRLFLESAYFNPVSIRKTAKRHGLKTDASFRYERGCDPSITVYAIKRAAELIAELAGASVISEIMDYYPVKIEPVQITLDYRHVNEVAGKEIEKQAVSKILLMLGMEVHSLSEEQLSVKVPLNKADVTRPIDLIEEILRIYGYNNIEVPDVLTYKLDNRVEVDEFHQIQQKISLYLADNGFYEVMNNSLTKFDYAQQFDFVNENETVKLLNPLSNELNVLRQTLLFSCLECVERNVNNKNANLRLFEFGKTYHLNTATQRGDDVVQRYQERQELALVVTGKDGEDSWNHTAKDLDFFYLRNMVENLLVRVNFPVNELSVITDDVQAMFIDHLTYCKDGVPVAVIGQVSPLVLKTFGLKKPVYYAEVKAETVAGVVTGREVRYTPIAVYPVVRRDLALVVDQSVSYDTLEKIGYKYGSKLVKNISLFDVYEGGKILPGKKSYALNFMLQHADKTLTDEEINKVMNKLVAAYEREVGAVLR
jgi:phenylalanyl-tRNA synthetase, beta subunit, non-spirochete bacterial